MVLHVRREASSEPTTRSMAAGPSQRANMLSSPQGPKCRLRERKGLREEG